ncbi:hypothetical protein [Nitrospirillum sp. BR 11828]|uniref:hypothetical protein n=1 Tax=Nitrospirillum sp. BR 11828 TaxID=3104325 RepID=UPI002ACA563A|nr:hypothetical protein [Nitrospirillum sp. BR 11828]MDZ5645699.1 hypothetical protein [Nitrospirillum sp. BR 11828]
MPLAPRLRDYLRQAFQSPAPAFAFDLMIPKDWIWFEKDGQPNKVNGRLQLLAHYGNKEQSSIIEIYAQKIDREMAPEDWLDQWMQANHYTIIARRTVASDAGRNADVLASRTIEGRPYLYRLRTFKNGKFIYLLHSFAEEARYASAEDAFLVAATSFNLTAAKPQQPYAEELQDVPLHKVFQVGFKIPSSWTVKPDESVDAACESWGLSNGSGTDRVGMINVYTAPRNRFKNAQEIALYATDAVRKLGIDPTGGTLAEVPIGDPVVSLWTSDSFAKLDDRSMLVRQVVLGTSKGWAIFTLISPVAATDPYLVTAINKRALEIAYIKLLTASSPTG